MDCHPETEINFTLNFLSNRNQELLTETWAWKAPAAHLNGEAIGKLFGQYVLWLPKNQDIIKSIGELGIVFCLAILSRFLDLGQHDSSPYR